MIRSFIKLTIRNFSRQFTYSLINVVGLAVGMACSLVILIYVLREKSYERHFEGYENVYRIGTKFMSMGRFANGPKTLLEVLPQEYPWIENSTRVKPNDIEVSVGQTILKESGLFVDEGFFKVFPFKFRSGGPSFSADNIALSKSLAVALFGPADPIGQTVLIKANEVDHLYTVTGVIDTDQFNSHVNAPFWAIDGKPDSIEPSWLSIDTYNYIRVSEGTSEHDVQRAMDGLVESKVYPMLGGGQPFNEWLARDDSFQLIVQPLRDIYLKGTLAFDLTPGGNAAMVDILTIVGALILLIAAVNFVNLSTARSTRRAREVGIKKVIGSTRRQLIVQFMSESIFTSLLALVLALGVAELILLVVEGLTGIRVLTSVFANSTHLMMAVSLALSLGIASGIYPSVILSSFKPAQVLKSNHSGSTRSSFRNMLVVFQFTLSTILIIGTFIVYRQLNYMTHRDMGFSTDNLLVVDNVNVLDNRLPGLKEKVLSLAGVTHASLVNRMPGSGSSYSIQHLKSDFVDEPITINRFMGDFDYPATLGFQLVEGRYFDPSIASDSVAVILNQSAVAELGLKEPIGARLNDRFVVVGVVRDFNFESLRSKILPSVIAISNGGYELAVRISGGNTRQIIAEIEKYWSASEVEEPFRYHFLDDNFQSLMRNEAVLSKILSMFSGLAILIACLGLFGLSAYLSIQRRKEVGVRKAVGASASSILSLFASEYSRLILISFIIAVPSSIFLTGQWLSTFAYRVGIEWWAVSLACLAVMILAWTTVGYHSYKVARINPAETLREN